MKVLPKFSHVMEITGPETDGYLHLHVIQNHAWTGCSTIALHTSSRPQHGYIMASRVKSGIFGQTAKFRQSPCLFHSSVNGIKSKLTTKTVEILMRRLIRSHLIWISTVCKCVSEFTRLYPTYPSQHGRFVPLF